MLGPTRAASRTCERVRLLDALLREASGVLASGTRISPELARTIRVASSALRVRRARLLNPPGAPTT